MKEFNILLNLQNNLVEETYIEVLRNDIDINAFNITLTDNYIPRNLTGTIIHVDFFKADLNTFVQDNVRDRVDTSGKFSIELENTSYDILGEIQCTVRVFNTELIEMYNKSFIFYTRDSFALPPAYDYNVAVAEIAKILRDSGRADIQLREAVTLTVTTLSVLNQAIIDADTPTTALENGIFLANVLKTNLENLVEQATTRVGELEGLIDVTSSASVLNTQLLATIGVGNTLKTDLEALILSGDFAQVKSDMEAIQLAMESLHEHGNKAVLDLLTDSSGSLLYNGNQVGVGDMTKAEYDLDNDGTVDNAKHSETSGYATNAGSAVSAVSAGNADTVGGKQATEFAPSGYGLGIQLSNLPLSSASTGKALITGMYYLLSSAPDKPTVSNDCALLVMAYSDTWVSQLAIDWRTNKTYTRIRTNGTWSTWGDLGVAGKLATTNWTIEQDTISKALNFNFA